ncbi:28890_t:CDS:2, partial [Gigaspora margarita]
MHTYVLILTDDSNTKLNKDLEDDFEIRRLCSESIYNQDNRQTFVKADEFYDLLLLELDR